MKRPRITLLVPTFQPRDAVGNDVLGMYECFRSGGYSTSIHAEHIHPDYEPIAKLIRQPEDSSLGDILIYHHAIHWPLGEKILENTRKKVVIKYHNVTPPQFYANYNAGYYWACAEGVAASKRLARRPDAWIWGDSGFNTREFIEFGASQARCRVVPPIHHTEDLAAAPLDTVVLGAHRGREPSVLFVGAFRPNKGHRKALECFTAYQRLSRRPAQMLFVGGFDAALADYVAELKLYAQYLGVEDDIRFCPSVSSSQLRAYYYVASVFLCVSEHEGFCVPLVEAMYFRLPIVAWGSTAVGETARGSGVVFDDFDADRIGQAMEELIENPIHARCLAEQQRDRYEAEFRLDVIHAKLLDLIGEVERET